MEETANCVFGQSLQNFQWIIIDDFSPNRTIADETLNIYRSRNDSRILFIDLKENQGLPGARNAGLKYATGKYTILLDPDDLIENTYLEKAVWFLETHPNYTMTNSWTVGFSYKEYTWQRGFHDGDINLKENMNTVTTVIRTEILKELGGFDAGLKYGMEDWDLWMKMANHGYWGHTLDEFHFWYRVSPPGKWSAIYNATLFNMFMDGQKEKYPIAYSKGVPKLSRPHQEKMEAVKDDVGIINPLKKCRPRVLFIIPHMELGGADQFNFNLAKGLVNDNWEVSIATTRIAANKWYSQFLRVTPDIFVMSRFAKTTDQTRFLSYLIKSRDFDVVFVSNSEYGYHYLSYLRVHAPGPAYVDYTHAGSDEWKSGGYARYSAGSQVSLDRSIYVSEQLKKYSIQLGHNPNKTAMVMIGVDSNMYKPVDESVRVQTRKDLGFPDDVFMISYVARLDPEKQPHVFAEVLRRIDEMGYDYRALSMGDGVLARDLNETVTNLNLGNKIKLLGSIPNANVSRYVSSSDIVFLPSNFEGIALSIYEGMSQGVCAVSSRVGGQAELITPDVGYLVYPFTSNEVDDYTNILAYLISNRTHSRELGKKSREKIENGFSVIDTIRRIKEEFCNAAITSIYSTQIFNIKALSKITNEVSVLGFEYERAETEMISLWNNFQASEKRCAVPKSESGGKLMKRIASPFPSMTPEEVLESIDLSSLRIVDDIFVEKHKYDKKMKVILSDYQESSIRSKPKVLDPSFNYNVFLQRENHGVSNWEGTITFPYPQQEYVAHLSQVFIGSGISGTIFDWERVFLLQPFKKVAFEMPSNEYKKCDVIINKKVASLLQIYFSYDNFIIDELPKLALLWDEIQQDPEIKLLVPNIPYSKIIIEELLKVPSNRTLYFNSGEGWDPCKVFYADSLLLPNPTVPSHAPKDLMMKIRNIIYDRNNIPLVQSEPLEIDDSLKVRSEIPNERNLIIYSSRRKTPSKSRRVSNEDELIESLRETIQLINSKDERFKEHPLELFIWDGEEVLNKTIVEYASRSRMLIGMTGSNLAPMIACNPGTVLVEFMHENPWVHWWATSQSLDLDHWMVPMKGVFHDTELIKVPVQEIIKTFKKSILFSDQPLTTTSTQ